MSNGAQMHVHVVRGAETVVVTAVAGQLRVPVDQEVAVVQVLVRGKAVAALEEEERRVLVPRTPCRHVARPGAEMRKPERGQIALLHRGVAPEEVLVGVDPHRRTRRGFVEGVHGLVSGVVTVPVDQDAPGVQGLVTVAPEHPAAAVAHGDGPPRAVDDDSRVGLEHARDRAVAEEARGQGVVVHSFTTPRNLAEEQPFVEPVVDVVPLGPAAAVPGQFECRRGARPVVLLQVPKMLPGALALVVGGITRHTDAPVLIAVPAVVEDVAFRPDVGVHRPVHIAVKTAPLLRGPVFVAQVVHNSTPSQVRAKRHVSSADRPVHRLHGHVDGAPPELRVFLDGAHQGHGHQLCPRVSLLLTRDSHNALVRIGAIPGQTLQFGA